LNIRTPSPTPAVHPTITVVTRTTAIIIIFFVDIIPLISYVYNNTEKTFSVIWFLPLLSILKAMEPISSLLIKICLITQKKTHWWTHQSAFNDVISLIYPATVRYNPQPLQKKDCCSKRIPRRYHPCKYKGWYRHLIIKWYHIFIFIWIFTAIIWFIFPLLMKSDYHWICNSYEYNKMFIGKRKW